MFYSLSETRKRVKYENLSEDLSNYYTKIQDLIDEMDWSHYESISDDNGYSLEGDYYDEYLYSAEAWANQVTSIKEACESFLEDLDACISKAEAKASMWREKEEEELERREEDDNNGFSSFSYF